MPAQPELTAGLITPKQLHELVQDATKIAGKDYLLVDVMRTDVDVGFTSKLLDITETHDGCSQSQS